MHAVQQHAIAGEHSTAEGIAEELALKVPEEFLPVRHQVRFQSAATGPPHLLAGVNLGADGLAGTDDDVSFAEMGGTDSLFSSIASIVIGGRVSGTVGAGDHFGFVAQEIGSLSINGVPVSLASGRSNDTATTNFHYILGATRDVTVHELAG